MVAHRVLELQIRRGNYKPLAMKNQTKIQPNHSSIVTYAPFAVSNQSWINRLNMEASAIQGSKWMKISEQTHLKILE